LQEIGSCRRRRRNDASLTGICGCRQASRLEAARRQARAAHARGDSRLSIDAIAARVGYQDGAGLRKLIRREFATTPRALRGA